MNNASFEEAINAGNGSIGKVIQRNNSLSGDLLVKILNKFPEVNANWLLTGKGEMYWEKGGISKENLQGKGIPILTIEEFSLLKTTTNLDKITNRIYLPFAETSEIDFFILLREGVLSPSYESGDYIACQLIKEQLFIQWNKPHFLYSKSQGVILRRLLESKKKNTVIARSEVKSYLDFELPISDIQTLALVRGTIRLE